MPSTTISAGPWPCNVLKAEVGSPSRAGRRQSAAKRKSALLPCGSAAEKASASMSTAAISSPRIVPQARRRVSSARTQSISFS